MSLLPPPGTSLEEYLASFTRVSKLLAGTLLGGFLLQVGGRGALRHGMRLGQG